MKRRNLFMLLATVGLFSCQQQDEQENLSKEAIRFSTSIDNESVVDAFTRSSNTLSLPMKSNFSVGDVISMSVSNEDYIPFTLGMDNRTWDEIDANQETVTFYAHYPELSNDVAATRSLNKRYRKIEGGKEHLFGTATVTPWSKNISLQFKRMTVPVVVLDEDGQPYNGDANIKLFLKNEGTQDLFNGTIEVNENAEREYIGVNKISEGSLTNVIPQSIKAGEQIGTITVAGKEQPIVAEQNVSLKAGSALTMRVGFYHNIIIDQQTPLRR